MIAVKGYLVGFKCSVSGEKYVFFFWNMVTVDFHLERTIFRFFLIHKRSCTIRNKKQNFAKNFHLKRTRKKN